MRVKAEKTESNAMRYTYSGLRIGDQVRFETQSNDADDIGIVVGEYKYFYEVATPYGYRTTVWKDRTTPTNVVRAMEDADRKEFETTYGIHSSFPTGDKTYGGPNKSDAGMVALGDGNYRSKGASDRA